MADKSTVVVESESGSPSAIAFKLMDRIAHRENAALHTEQEKRDYWIKLFVQCRVATQHGTSAEQALKQQ